MYFQLITTSKFYLHTIIKLLLQVELVEIKENLLELNYLPIIKFLNYHKIS